MAILLIVIIYLIFISLGLPDGLLGSSWPAIRQDWSQPVGLGGLMALTVTIATILSSLATSYLVKKLGVGVLMATSVGFTALALIGFSQASSIYWLFILALPLGFGAGAIDSALNDYVSKHYKAHHMNWLHAFWGVGATLGPVIFGASLAATQDWHSGYGVLGYIQIGIVIIVLLTISLWKRNIARSRNANGREQTYRVLLRRQPVRHSFIVFLLYTGLEVAVGLWLASYLVAVQAVTLETAALWTGLYFAGITVGRLLTGFVSFRLSSTSIVRIGISISLFGILLLALNENVLASTSGILLIGLGFAPIYPMLIHITPKRFGNKSASKVMSLQMVGGYIGASLIPPSIGLLAGLMTFHVFIVVMVAVIGAVFVYTELLNRSTSPTE